MSVETVRMSRTQPGQWAVEGERAENSLDRGSSWAEADSAQHPPGMQ